MVSSHGVKRGWTEAHRGGWVGGGASERGRGKPGQREGQAGIKFLLSKKIQTFIRERRKLQIWGI